MSLSKAFCVAALVATIGVSAASASTVGVTVSANGSNTVVGVTAAPGAGPDGGNQLGATAVQYYITLGNANGTYGVGGFGLSSDTGNGGGTESMFLKFSPVSGNSVLTVRFQDLDLNHANDPAGFLESLRVYTGGGTALTPLITDIGGLVTGNSSEQVLKLALGVVNDPLWLRLDFRASSTFDGRNTAEYLVATVDPVPLPGALPLFVTGLGALGLLNWRRKRKALVA